MADGILIDPGTTTEVATDDCGASGHAQIVKLAIATDGSATAIPADANGLLVNLGANNDVVVSDGGNVISVDDGAGSLTVDNAVLSVVGGGTEAAAQRVTIASDSTGVLSVDDNGSSLTVDGSVSIGSALPAGTNAIGKLAANSGVDIGDVDVTSVTPGTAAASLGKAEDAAHSDGDVGVMMLGVADFDGATGTGVEDGDYAPIALTQLGHVWTVNPSIWSEDAPHTTGDQGVQVLGVRNDAGTTLAGTDGDYIPLSMDSAGALRVTGGGGGTQYTEADTDASITGTAILWEDTSDTLRAVSAAKPLPVGDGGGSLTVDGTVTANAGTNLNTSALALETGGNLAGAATSLAVIDDWDETDRAKVNIVAGQAGITAGAGAVAANTPRVTHASDDPVTTSVQLIDDAIVADDAAFTPATTKVMMAGFEADESSTDSVDEGDGGAARMTLDRKLITNPQPHAAGGLSTFHSNDLDETEEDVKTSAGCVYGWIITNRTTAAVYIHFYNATAANVTVGTTAPLFIFAVPGNASDYVAAHLLGGMGITFDTAISVAATTDFPDDGSPAGPATNAVLCTVFYK